MKDVKLKFYSNPKLAQDEIHIGKSGQLRFKKLAVEEFKIEKGQRFMIGTDTEEKPIKHIYLVRSQNEGFKVSQGNKTFVMNLKGVIAELGLKLPIGCKYEAFEKGNYKGIKVILN